MDEFKITTGVTFSNVTPINIFLLDVYFDKIHHWITFFFLYPPCLQNFKMIRD